MRTIKELLILLKDEYKSYNDKYPSLCNAAKSMFNYDTISRDEYKYIREYLYENKPKKEYYYTCNDKITTYETQFWYKISDRFNRYRWLNKHIKLNS